MSAYVLEVYKERGVWLIDDREHGLVREPLVFGMEKLLDRFVADFHYDAQGFLLTISDHEQPDTLRVLLRQEADAGGYWYASKDYGKRGWMGNAGLERYFPKAPKMLYCSARSRPAPTATNA